MEWIILTIFLYFLVKKAKKKKQTEELVKQRKIENEEKIKNEVKKYETKEEYQKRPEVKNIEDKIKYEELKKFYNETNEKYQNIDYNKYKNYSKKLKIMTEYEYIFYQRLKEYLKDTNLEIQTQVSLQAIINVDPKAKGQMADRGRIKQKYIDYVVINQNEIICCIELDDYTHARAERVQRDDFLNELFLAINLRLIRVKNISDYDKVGHIIKIENRKKLAEKAKQELVAKV
ncbi:MAG: DUF2726 domain-containing protein [Clostridia bacterium]|nr:DUF2726 domain-containing protein [Clostridia bacterium]